MADYISEIRRKVGHDRILVPGSCAVIVDDRKGVLLIRRSDTGEWSTPGGTMSFDETVLESLRREVREETGLEIGEPRLLAVYAGSEFDDTLPNGDQVASVTLAFLVEDYGGEPTPSEESPEVRFHRLEELPEDLNFLGVRLIEDYLAYREGRAALPIIR